MHKLFYRIGAETKEELQVDDLFFTTLEELRTDIATRTGFDAKRLRLVKAGKVLQGDPDMTLESLGLQDGDTLYVARLATNSVLSSSPQDSQAPISGSLLRTAADNQDVADPMAQLFDNPFIQSMFSNSDLMSSLLESDPRIAQMAEKNPELRSMMRDPQFLQNAMNMMKNPAARKEMMRNQDRQLSNIEALPGGFNYLSSVFKDMQDPLGDSGEDPSTDEANKRLANAFGVKKASSPVESGPNSEPLPNPWAPPPQSSSRPLDSNNMMNRLGLFGSNSPFMSSAFSPASSSNSSSMPPQNNIMQSRAGGPPQGDLMEQMQWMQSLLAGPQGQSSTSPFIGSGFPLAVPSTSTPAAPPIDPEVTFTSQLTQLQEMGFSDRDKNKRALLAAGGNVQAAISYMLDRL